VQQVDFTPDLAALLLSGPLLYEVQGIAVGHGNHDFNRVFGRNTHAQAGKFCGLVSLQRQGLSLLGIALPAYARMNGEDLDLAYTGLGDNDLGSNGIDILLPLGQESNLAGHGGNEEEGVHSDLLIKKTGP